MWPNTLCGSTVQALLLLQEIRMDGDFSTVQAVPALAGSGNTSSIRDDYVMLRFVAISHMMVFFIRVSHCFVSLFVVASNC